MANHTTILINELQCGRIYKDAEMSDEEIEYRKRLAASMWPHL